MKLFETIADISYIAGEKRCFSGDSRYDVSRFIEWAIEFEKMNISTDWDEQDYISMITEYATDKIKSAKKELKNQVVL